MSKPRFDLRERYLSAEERAQLEVAEGLSRENTRATFEGDLCEMVTRLLNELARYDRALQSLTPGGSEFVAAPEHCARFAEAMMRMSGKEQAR